MKIVLKKTSKQEKIYKMAYIISALVVNPTTHKISIGKANKIK
jgi:hypothetical protein